MRLVFVFINQLVFVDPWHHGAQAVADFLDFHAAGIHWPAFNVADTSITVGAALLIFESLFARRESPKNGSGTSDMTDN